MLSNPQVNEDEKGVYTADGLYEVKDIEDTSEKAKPSRFMSLLNSLTGQYVISAEELDPVLASMREHLVNKNVASDIASHLCDSVKTTIVGKKLGSFQSKGHPRRLLTFSAGLCRLRLAA